VYRNDATNPNRPTLTKIIGTNQIANETIINAVQDDIFDSIEAKPQMLVCIFFEQFAL